MNIQHSSTSLFFPRSSEASNLKRKRDISKTAAELSAAETLCAMIPASRQQQNASQATAAAVQTLLGQRQVGLVTTKDGQAIFARIKNRQMKVINMQQGDLLGKGSFGSVWKVLSKNLSTGKISPVALKIAKEGHSLDDENNILNTIHEGGIIDGIQKPPKHYSPEMGMLGSCYAGNLLNAINHKDFKKISGEAKLDACFRLAHGLYHLHRKGIRHGDIKPENILVKLDHPSLIPDLADFGGAREWKAIHKDVKTSNTALEVFAGTHTQGFLSGNDIAAANLAIIANNFPQLKKIGEAADVFALGKTFYALLTGRDLLTGDTTTAIKNRIIACDQSPDVANAITSMVAKDYLARPTAKDIKEALDSCVRSGSRVSPLPANFWAQSFSGIEF